MKIGISAAGNRPDSPIDARFGRAGCFQVFDTDNGKYEVIDNSSGRDSMQGAGVQAGELVAGLGVSVMITGHCGPKAFRVLQADGIHVAVGARGTAREAVEQFTKGTIKPTDAPDVVGHWA